MKEKIEGFGQSCIWHFTDKSNYESIMDSGLVSWKHQSGKKIVSPAPGGNDWSHQADARVGIDSYVHLAFSTQHPMLYVARQEGRIKDPIWLKISLDVLSIEGVRYTSGVANKAGVLLLNNEQAKKSVDLEGIYNFLDFKIEGNKERKHAAEKSQVLVPDLIPLNFILGFVNG